ncbi:MAG: hypothetical protein ACM3IL_00365 [Deltaproteobacteria bacterium]
MLKKKAILRICFIFCLILFNSARLEASALRIDQSKIRFIAPPGEARNGEINIDNTEDRVMHVKVYPEEWTYSSKQDGTKEFQVAGVGAFSASGWITFFPSEFDVPPFGRQTVNYTVRVPQDAVGGHYAVLFFEHTLGDVGQKENVGMNLIMRIGVIFYIEPQGTIVRKAEVKGLNFTKTKEGYLGISADFKNTGNVDLLCSATFDIIDNKGQVYARGKFDDIYTLPGDNATLTGTWSEPIPKGTYDLIVTLDLSKAPGEDMPLSGQVITKEAQIQCSADGAVSKIGELK